MTKYRVLMLNINSAIIANDGDALVSHVRNAAIHMYGNDSSDSVLSVRNDYAMYMHEQEEIEEYYAYDNVPVCMW